MKELIEDLEKLAALWSRMAEDISDEMLRVCAKQLRECIAKRSEASDK